MAFFGRKPAKPGSDQVREEGAQTPQQKGRDRTFRAVRAQRNLRNARSVRKGR